MGGRTLWFQGCAREYLIHPLHPSERERERERERIRKRKIERFRKRQIERVRKREIIVHAD